MWPQVDRSGVMPGAPDPFRGVDFRQQSPGGGFSRVVIGLQDTGRTGMAQGGESQENGDLRQQLMGWVADMATSL